MADIQNHFINFHSDIRLGTYDEVQTLQDKKCLILSSLEEGINKQTKDGEPNLSWSNFDQGSYALHTGVKPLHKADDYDIDVGIIFKLKNDNEELDIYRNDPVLLKDRVERALQHANRDVSIKEPCVRVQYKKNGENDYHVDLAIYSDELGGLDRVINPDYLKLARGKRNSSDESKKWDKQDPKGLIIEIRDKYETGWKRDQYRRVVRYLKRWKDGRLRGLNVVSIALTSACYHRFSPVRDILSQEENDLESLKRILNSMLNCFIGTRLTIELPVYPENDLLEKVTDIQMTQFKEKLERFRDDVQGAIDTDDNYTACKLLSKHLDGFPIPDKSDNSDKGQKPYSASGISA